MASTKTKTIAVISAAILGTMIWYLNAPKTDIDGIPITSLCAVENDFIRADRFADGYAGYPSAPEATPDAVREFLDNPEKVKIWREASEKMKTATIAKFEHAHKRSFDDIWTKWTEYRAATGISCDR